MSFWHGIWLLSGRGNRAKFKEEVLTTIKNTAVYRMSRPSRTKGIIRLWIGIVSLSVSALLWIMLFIAIVAEPEEVGQVIISGLVLSSIPLGVGIYYVRRGKRRYERKVFYG